MLLSDFHYDLPQELIALYPPEKRGDSRLLTLDGQTGETKNRLFKSLPDLLRRDDLLVFNDTRVIPARQQNGSLAKRGRFPVLLVVLFLPREIRAAPFLSRAKSGNIRISRFGTFPSAVHLRERHYSPSHRVLICPFSPMLLCLSGISMSSHVHQLSHQCVTFWRIPQIGSS